MYAFRLSSSNLEGFALDGAAGERALRVRRRLVARQRVRRGCRELVDGLLRAGDRAEKLVRAAHAVATGGGSGTGHRAPRT